MTKREQLIEDAREFWLSTEPSSTMFEVMVDFAEKVSGEKWAESTNNLINGVGDHVEDASG